MASNRKLGGKQPTHLRPTGCLTVRERIWAAIRARRTGFTRADIAFDAKVSEGSVRSYTDLLARAGILRALDRWRSQDRYRFTWMRYALARDLGVEAPRLRPDGKMATVGLGREQLWRTVKILGDFDAPELARVASTRAVPVAMLTAMAFMQQLARGGYAVLIKRGSPGRRSRYRFVPSMNTGPRPPVAQKSGAIFDPNLGKFMYRRGEVRA